VINRTIGVAVMLVSAVMALYSLGLLSFIPSLGKVLG